jgi:hypothetical protein
MANYPKKMEIYEILQKFETAKNEQERVKVLQQNDIMPLLDVLRGTFDNSIQWNLPGGTPPYTPSSDETPPSSLLRQHRNFKYFVKGLQESSKLTTVRRERMFIDMLEAVHPNDAEILVSMINKKSPVKGLTKKIVEEVFPELIQS